MFAKDALNEIEEWRKTNAAHYQLDWRWVERYRKLCAYDTYWWWAQAGPFNDEEQRQWELLFTSDMDEATKDRLGVLVAQSRARELQAAIAEQREPRLHYPALAIEEVRTHITDLLQLDAEINQQEPNAIVRRLYHEAIDEEVRTLRLIASTYEGNNARFWELTRSLFPEPTREEMEHALFRLIAILKQGLASPVTREISKRLVQFIHERLQLSLDLSSSEEKNQELRSTIVSSPSDTEQRVSVQAAKRFFETLLHEYEYKDWEVIIDPNAQGARVEQGMRRLFLADSSLSIKAIRHYISHELAGHVGRCIAGEHSPVGLLGIHTKNSLEAEEGLAIFYDRQTALLQGQAYDDTAVWIGTLATGLASGIVTPPQTFSMLFTFFELFYVIRRIVMCLDADVQIATEKARTLALMRCLRTFRGVPDLKQPGVCFTKDVLYLRGLWRIERALAQDDAVLDRLGVGVVALEQLPDLDELGIVAPAQTLRELVVNPRLDVYILSFEKGGAEA